MNALFSSLAASAGLIAALGLPACARAAEVVVVSSGSRCAVVVPAWAGYPYAHTLRATFYPTCTYTTSYTSYTYTSYVYTSVYPYAAYAYYAPYYRVYAPVTVAYGPAGAAVYGPYGGFAATTGVHTTYSANGWSTQRASATWSPWTGTGTAVRGKTAYDANTNTYAAGQRGGAANAYTGDYGYGERGAAYNANTGAAAAGGHATVGNAYTGREAEVARGVAYDPRTGEVVRAGGVQGENGGVARVNDQVYVGHDGQVQQVTPGARASTSVASPQRSTSTTPQRPTSTTPQRSTSTRPQRSSMPQRTSAPRRGGPRR